MGSKSRPKDMSAQDMQKWVQSLQVAGCRKTKPCIAQMAEKKTIEYTRLRTEAMLQADDSFVPADSDFEAAKKIDYDKYVNYYKVLGVPQAASSKKIGEHHRMLEGLMNVGFDIISNEFKKKDDAARKPVKA